MNDIDVVNQMQHQVNTLFFNTFKNVDFNREGFSAPLVPRISPQYLKNRVVIMGQETNTWRKDKPLGKLTDLSDIEDYCLNKCLDEFLKTDVSKYKGHFWKFCYQLYSDNILQGNMIKNNTLSHCWLNLFCIEKCKDKGDRNGCPSKNEDVAKEVLSIQKHLLYHLFDILRPKVIIAIIGPDNDNKFIEYALNATNKCTIKTIDKKIHFSSKLSEFLIEDSSNCLINTTIIRSYHPNYFFGRMKRDYKLEYQETLFNKLKQILQ